MNYEPFPLKARSLAALGYIPIPVEPHTKTPRVQKWQYADKPSLQFGHKIQIVSRHSPGDFIANQHVEILYRRWLADARHHSHSTGILLGYRNLIQLDFDVDNKNLSRQFEGELFDLCPSMETAVFRTAGSSKFSILARSDRKFTGSIKSELPGFEIRGGHRQMLVAGIHPTTNQPYETRNPIPKLTQLPEIPYFLFAQITKLYDGLRQKNAPKNSNIYFELGESKQTNKIKDLTEFEYSSQADDIKARLGEGTGYDFTQEYIKILMDMNEPNSRKKKYKWTGFDLLRQFNLIPKRYWDDRDFWLLAGMALHDVQPNEMMYRLWTVMSQRSKKYNAKTQRETWNAFELKEGRDSISMGSITRLTDRNVKPLVSYRDVIEFQGRIKAGGGIRVRDLFLWYQSEGGSLPRKAFTNWMTRQGYKKKVQRINGKTEMRWQNIAYHSLKAHNFIREMEL